LFLFLLRNNYLLKSLKARSSFLISLSYISFFIVISFSNFRFISIFIVFSLFY